MEKLNLTTFETKENAELNWPNSPSWKQHQSDDSEEQVIRKYEIFIDLKKSKNYQSFDGKSISSDTNSVTSGIPPTTTVGQGIDSFLFLSDDDSDSGAKCLVSASSDAESSLDGSARNLSRSVSTNQVPNEEEATDGTEDASRAPHFIKYVNRNGKLIKIWECGICARNFQHQYTLMRHLPTHTNVRNFVCNECGKAFRQLSTLSQHRAIHSVERPYACETCNKSFNRISTLISHRKTHSDVKPFRCHLCNKGFHQKGNLRNHIYIHTNARPYRCSLCNKGFNQMSNLVCHTQKSHSAEIGSVWTCHRCNMSFSKRTLLRAHELETHQIQSASKYNKTKALYSRKNTMGIPSNATPQGTTDVTVSQSQISENGIVIPAIETDAMKTAKTNKEIPFAVLHFIEGLPLLVRIIDYGSQSLLRPANDEDFAALKQQQKNPQEKISVPVVAAVYQTLNPSGRPEFTIMSPKNIYKFSNPQQISLDVECDKSTPTTVSINPPIDVLPPPSEDAGGLLDVSRMEVSSFYEELASVKAEPLILEESDVFLNDVIDMSDSSSPKMANEEKPKAIAIVEDSTWKNIKSEGTEEVETFSEAFRNIATGNLLTPKRVQECDFTLPEQNGDEFDLNFGYGHPVCPPVDSQFDCGDSDLLSSFLNNAISEDIDINILRNLISDSQKFFSDFDTCVSELFPS